MITPSALERVERCPTSEALPHVRRETAYSSHGTAAHRYLQEVRELGREKALANAATLEERLVLEAIPLDDPRMPSMDPAAYTAELAVALHLELGSARILGKGLTREQAHALAGEGEMVGIIDLAGRAGDAAVVLDFKFGHGDVPRAAVNLQLWTYVLMLARAQELAEGHLGLVHVWGDEVWTDVATVDGLELEDHLDRVRRIVAAAEAAKAAPPDKRVPNEGDWCLYCPAFTACPAKQGLLSALVHVPETVLPIPTEGGALPALEELGRGYSRLKLARQVVDRAEAVYKGLARVAPLPLGGGKFYGEKKRDAESLVPQRAAEVIVEAMAPLGQVVVNEARSEMTWAAFERAFKKHVLPTMPRLPSGKPRPWAEVERELRAFFKEKGAMRVTPVTEVKEFSVKPEKKRKGNPEGQA